MRDLSFTVLGAGVVGLTTALELQKHFRNASINIVAHKLFKETTSYVAAGIFRPGSGFCGPTEAITRKWIEDAYYYWDDLRFCSDYNGPGVMQVSGYIFSSEFAHIVRNDYIEKLVPIYRTASDEELMLCPGNWKYGSFFSTLLIECKNFIPWATLQFENAGGTIIQQNIDSFADLTNHDTIILNCTGLGAKHLCHDSKLVAIRGQVSKVKAPWIKTFFYGDYDTYIIPGYDSVTLGGCRQYDSYNTDVCKYDAKSIRERCEKLVPSLNKAELISHYVGLRPHRDPVRVEMEILEIMGKKLKVVHNYGHGGYGVTTAPGTAKHAVNIVRNILTGNSKL